MFIGIGRKKSLFVKSFDKDNQKLFREKYFVTHFMAILSVKKLDFTIAEWIKWR